MKYIERKRIGVELEDLETRVPILELKTYSLYVCKLWDRDKTSYVLFSLSEAQGLQMWHYWDFNVLYRISIYFMGSQ